MSFLLVSYNSARHMASCLRAILAQTAERDDEILLVDNGDGSTEALVRADFPQVTILPARGNIGYGRGNNYLAAHASGDVLVIVNPDIVIGAGAVARLAALAEERRDVAAFAPVFLRPDGSPGADNFLMPPFFLNLLAQFVGLHRFWRRAVLARRLGAERRVAWTSGSFFAVRAAAWRTLGGFDESFFLYGEEMDFFARLRTQGMAILRSPALTAVHDTGSGQRAAPERVVHLCRGCMHFCRKYRPWPLAALAGAMIWLMAVSRNAPRAGQGQPGERARFLRAVHPRHWWQGYR